MTAWSTERQCQGKPTKARSCRCTAPENIGVFFTQTKDPAYDFGNLAFSCLSWSKGHWLRLKSLCNVTKATFFRDVIEVNAKILKDSSPVIAPTITSLINDSFTLSTFPLPWKKAEIVPILKSGDSEEPANTRPISLLPSLSKVCERAAHSQFTNFLDSNNVIHHLQSGNRKLHSTESALLHFTDELLNNMDQKKISVVVFLDKSKAFDSIRHDLMLRTP